MKRSLFIVLILLVSHAWAETTLWLGPAENITKGTKGISELEMTIEGNRVTGYWRFLPDVEFVIEEGRMDNGMITWWHRNVEGRSFHIKLEISPDGRTALCDYWGRYPNPANDTRAYIYYSLVRRQK